MPLIANPKVYSLWLRSDVHGSAQTTRLCSSIRIANGVCQSTMTEKTLSFLCSKQRRPGSVDRSCSKSGKGIAVHLASSTLRKWRDSTGRCARSPVISTWDVEPSPSAWSHRHAARLAGNAPANWIRSKPPSPNCWSKMPWQVP